MFKAYKIFSIEFAHQKVHKILLVSSQAHETDE